MKKPVASVVASAVTIISLLGVTNFCAAAAPLKEMVPTGTLRVGVVEAPDAGTFFVAKDPKTHAVHGVTVDLGADLAHELGVPVTYTVFPNSGACTEATHSGAVDVAFMPVDALRRQQVAFGPAYYQVESTYLVSGQSKITDLAGVDQPGVRVVGISNTTTIRASARTLHHTVPKPIDSVQAAVEAMRSGQADALAGFSKPVFRSPCLRVARQRWLTPARSLNRPKPRAQCVARSMRQVCRMNRSPLQANKRRPFWADA